jgi:hypothetical protein
VVAAVTLVLYVLSELNPGVSSGVLYVLGVLLVATYSGLWLGLVTSVASVLALDYFHNEPQAPAPRRRSLRPRRHRRAPADCGRRERDRRPRPAGRSGRG